VTLNIADLAPDMVRSELFGHVHGEFPDKTSEKRGLVDVARGGVLFLDKIGELSLDVQAELLRFLEDGSYRPLGATELRHSNARVVAATHVDLDQAVQNNRFRRDLLARLRARNVPLELPPLRERREDILGWTQLFLRQGNHDAGPTPWTVGALECLLLYPWAKNLRDLRRVVAEVAAQSPLFPIGSRHLPTEIRTHHEILLAGGGLMRWAEPSPPMERRDITTSSAEPTRIQIVAALGYTQGRIRIAAQQLGIERSQLLGLCERLGIALDAYGVDLSSEDE
jgi:two-component system NtrC family response regulator